MIRFYLNANKDALSETVIRGGGRGGERKRKCLFCPPLPSQQLVVVVVRQVPPVPAASLCPFL